jgi:hypothetical protein
MSERRQQRPEYMSKQQQRQPRGTRKGRQQQIQEFVAALFEPNDWVELRLIPRKVEGMKIPVKKEWYLASELHKKCGHLYFANISNTKYNIHVGICPRADDGLSGDKNVALARCLFADFDFDHETDYLKYVRDLIAQHGLPAPTVTVLSGHGIHTFFRLKEALDIDKWREMQERLIKTLGCDDACSNPERLLRLPGYVNWKIKEGF